MSHDMAGAIFGVVFTGRPMVAGHFAWQAQHIDAKICLLSTRVSDKSLPEVSQRSVMTTVRVP